jgi:5'-3' exonuclease
MDVFLVDGTYELFRHYFAMPKREHEGQEIAATRGVIASLLGMIDDGAEYLGLATDSVVTSFRNEMWDGYKDGSDMPADILSQFPILEDAVVALGIRLWPMTDLEADDALAAAARSAAAYDEVDRVLICSPDKDMAQSVVGSRVVQFDRRQGEVRDADGVVKKFGVQPESIPDYLALVGDSADGIPGIPGWGAKSTATVLAHYTHLERIPSQIADWEVVPRGAARLAENLAGRREDAALYKRLATLREDVPLAEGLEDLRWRGAHRKRLQALCEELDDARLSERVSLWAD